MKFKVQVGGEAALGLSEQDVEIEAVDGTEASNAIRDQLTALAPKEGGDLDVEIYATESWSRIVNKNGGGTIEETFPPGLVSRFSFHVQPHESVREKAAARRADADLAKLSGNERTKERIRLLLDLSNRGVIDQVALAAALVDASLSLESVVEQAAAGKAVAK